jgi:hypothetical protein
MIVLLTLALFWTLGAALAVALCMAARQGDAAMGSPCPGRRRATTPARTPCAYRPRRASMYGTVRSRILRSAQSDHPATYR